MRKRNTGYTLIELITVVMIAVIGIIAVVWFGAIGSGNYWYTESGVLRELRIDHPNVTEIVKTTRNVFADSVITVNEDGAVHNYCLNSNILFNYEFSVCK
jgi:hypothetical protein